MHKKTEGFTLIELLVVIAIVGILSSIVLSSVNTVRVKANDTAIKSSLNSIGNYAAIVYDDNGSYDGLCDDDRMLDIMQLTVDRGSATEYTTDVRRDEQTWLSVCHVHVYGHQWAVSAALKSDSSNSWCVDSTGTSTMLVSNKMRRDHGSCSELVYN